MKAEMNRRNFLKAAGAIGIATAGASMLAACSSNSASDTKTEAETISFDREESCDIVVVGSGTAGTCAAITAAQQGANVICIEKNDNLGGTSNFAEYIGGFGAKIQTDAGIKFNITERVNGYQVEIDWGAPYDVVETLFVESGKTLDWLIDDCGIPFQPGGAADHLVIIMQGEDQIFLADGMLKPLWEMGESMDNLEFRTGTPMIGLVADNGTVTGVYAKESNDEIVKINAKSVLLCTGGFADNPDLFWEAMHQKQERFFNYGMPGRDGDGYQEARKLDASITGMPAMLAEPGVVGTMGYSEDPNIWFTWTPLPHFNENGKRYYDESCGGGRQNNEVMNNAFLAQNRAFVIADYSYMAEGEVAKMWEQYSSGRGLAGVEECSGVYKADTIEELAEMIDVPTDALKESVDTYNKACETGVDTEFGCAAEYLTPIKKAPFYAAELRTAIYCTNGGVVTDAKMRVKTTSGTIIDGLYACGSDNGTVYKNKYPLSTFHAIAQTWAAVSGHIAALDACSR